MEKISNGISVCSEHLSSCPKTSGSSDIDMLDWNVFPFETKPSVSIAPHASRSSTMKQLLGSSTDFKQNHLSTSTIWNIKRLLIVLSSALATIFWVAFGNLDFQDSYDRPPSRYQELQDLVHSTSRSGRGNLNNEKVFIAANIADESLIRGTWGQNLLELVDILGETNVFISIYENNGGRGTISALEELRQSLNCNASIVIDHHSNMSDLPIVGLPDGTTRIRRLAYLAELRNRLLWPLDPARSLNSSTGFQTAASVQFDRILFLNDVYYSPVEAAQLLFATNAETGRAEYRAACALDFVQLFKLYDTFVVRDTDGFRVPLQYFPWFTHRGSGTSLQDVLQFKDAVRVRSCWGGMAAFDAEVFQPKLSTSDTATVSSKPLSFRSGEEPFWEAAECCLLFADMEVQHGNALGGRDTDVFINPYIRTAYSPLTWKWLPFFKRYERILQPFQSLVDNMWPPERNHRRIHEPGQMVDELVWVNNNNNTSAQAFNSRINYGNMSPSGRFELQHREAAPGGFCGQRRMFVMKANIELANQVHGGKNWESVPVPRHVEPV